MINEKKKKKKKKRGGGGEGGRRQFSTYPISIVCALKLAYLLTYCVFGSCFSFIFNI